MFKIIVAILVIASGKVEIYSSEESYGTKEACDAQREVRVADVAKYLSEQNIEVQIRSVCDVDGQPT